MATAPISSAICRAMPASICDEPCFSRKLTRGNPAGVWRSDSMWLISPASVTELTVTLAA
jgi:hypothetical protein